MSILLSNGVNCTQQLLSNCNTTPQVDTVETRVNSNCDPPLEQPKLLPSKQSKSTGFGAQLKVLGDKLS